jgi:hypothetical protein
MIYGIIVIATSILTICLLIIGREAARRKRLPADPAPSRREPCPLCGSPLRMGDRIRSQRYTVGKDSIVHVHGCPRCYPSNDRFRRVCPVCRRQLDPTAFIVGRMWEKVRPAGSKPRMRLHIMGCPACRITAKSSK